MYWDFDRLAPPIYRLRGQRIGVRQMNQATAEMYYAEGLAALGVLEQALAGRDWLVGDGPTIADIDVYGVLDYAEAGGFDVAPFANVAAFMKRAQALPGFGRPLDLIPKENRKG
ncbi:MAG: glutathione S-transferase family protein [Phyllobacteriaceae bacterium]|nr:glutathione S-transferase family protein [Phyllobacteriaceae bacterium]